MPYFNSLGLRLHYLDEGQGHPCVLLHGFASSAAINWVDTGWTRLLAAHYRVLAPDFRGHGLSDKPHERAAYRAPMIEGDVIRMLDQLGIERTLIMGYSMGARIALAMVMDHPERMRAAVLGGIPIGGVMDTPSARTAVVEALLAEDSTAVADPIPRMFRRFAVAAHNDLEALAACMGSLPPAADPQRLAEIRLPVMVAAGSDDVLAAASTSRLAGAISGAKLLMLEGRDHMSAVGDKRFKAVVTEFFSIAPP